MDQQIKELNAFLEGEFMGIHAYEHYIQNTQDQAVKKDLQTIQQNHKMHAIFVAEQIQNLGGTAVDDVGIVGSFQERVAQVKGYPKETHDIIKGAIRGEEFGTDMMAKMVKGDLDQESKSIVQSILAEHQQHIELLRKHLK
ncbi:ferritin-like domain-containing protein [Sutcliffiella halmapala]|uniref:ferritin-like domain-containing protein n=1 Tax=Sutcliffiella halmapala TaxID=79882 RepID=UPI000995DC68|nr:ferritin-like domain-containing protein [Sutcliffiella halmapala]